MKETSHHHHRQKHFPQYKIITTTTGLWKLIFENNEDWFFLLEIYFCDYVFSTFIHTFLIYPVHVIYVAVVERYIFVLVFLVL